MSFHNTTNEKPHVVDLYETKARSQDEEVLALMKRLSGPASPSEVHAYFPLYPITSIRRAMTNLTSDGKLEKLDRKIKGPYGRPEYLWRVPKGQLRLL